jgi:hypothetical protein
VKDPCVPLEGDDVDRRWSAAGFGFRGLLAGTIALGAALRIAQWGHNRELWHDEAYLALDIAKRSYVELVGPLSHNMNYPIAFLLSTKLVTNCLGTSEYALRLLPLVAGIVSILLFVQLSRRIAGVGVAESTPGLTGASRRSGSLSRGGGIMVVVAAVLFAASKHHIYYSSELRHYALDVLVVCGLYLMALPRDAAQASPWRTVFLSLFGAVALWFSLASVFILAAIATVDIVSHAVAQEWRRAAWNAGWCIPWSLSFLAHLHLFHVNMALRSVGPEIAAICEYLSVPLLPMSGGDLRTLREALEHLFTFPGGFTYVGLAGFAFLLGCISLWKRHKTLLFLLVLPFLYAMLASSFHQYPFRNQYILFLLPGLYLVVAEGIGSFFEVNATGWRAAGVILAVLLLTQPTLHSLKVLAHPRSGPGGASEIKPLLAHVQTQWREGDTLYVCGDQRITVQYYGPQFGFQPLTPPRDLAPGIPAKQAYGVARSGISNAVPEEPGGSAQRFWLLYQGHEKLAPHTQPGSATANEPKEIEALFSESSSLYLYASAGDNGR